MPDIINFKHVFMNQTINKRWLYPDLFILVMFFFFLNQTSRAVNVLLDEKKNINLIVNLHNKKLSIEDTQLVSSSETILGMVRRNSINGL